MGRYRCVNERCSIKTFGGWTGKKCPWCYTVGDWEETKK